MQQQAILITAYKEFDQLLHLIKQFDSYFTIYIHIDKKSSFSNKQISKLKEQENVEYVGQDYKVNWGGVNHLHAYLQLCKIAMLNENNVYFHLISGQDIVVKKTAEFKKLLETKKDYLSHFSLPTDVWKGGGMDRLEQYNFHNIIDSKKYSFLLLQIQKLQRYFKIKRQLNHLPSNIYGGSTYWSLTRETLSISLKYSECNPNLLKRLNHTFCPEELFFQTIVMNSNRANNVTNDNLRFIDWDLMTVASPGVLTENHLEPIKKSNALFARKIELPASLKLQELIDLYLKY